MKIDLLKGASLAALFAFSAPVWAQSTEAVSNDAATTEDETRAIETIVVTGFRQANSAAIADKRSSDLITDGINQDTIGLLPDLTVAEIASRIPGVTSVPSSGVQGPRSLSASENIVIRGLAPDFNLSTFDGAPIATASESDRAANLSLFPPSIIGRVEAIKTLSADMNPHGLSGQLNLVTASAFDRNDAFGNLRLSVGDDSTAGQVVNDQGENLRASGLYGFTFGDQDQFGLVLAGSFEQFYSTARAVRPGGQADTYLFYTDDQTSNARVTAFADSNGFPAPRRNQIYLFENEQERASAVAKLEWRPSAQTYASLFGGWFYQDEQEVRHEFLAIADQALRPINQTLNTGLWPRARIEAGYVYQPEETTTTAITGYLAHDFDADSSLELTVSLSSAQVDVVRNMSKFQPPYSADTSFSYDMSSGEPLLTFVNPDLSNDPSLQTNSYIRERSQDIQQDLAFIDGAWLWNSAEDDRGFGVKLGASYLQRDHSFDREYIEGDVFNTDGCTEAVITNCPLVTFDQFVEDETFPTNDPNVFFFLVDDPALRAAWEAQGKPLTTDRTDNSINSDYTIDETIYALYAQGVWQTDSLEVHAGLRYDSTEADVDLFVRDLRLPSDPDSAQFAPASRSYEYDFLLPSLIASYEASDNLLLRGAYTRSIGRPNFEFIKRGETYTVPDETDPNDLRISISRGNTDLQPLVSDNFDISAEYYFGNGGSLVSVAGFYKSVDDLIYIRTEVIENFEYEGRSFTATVNQPVNATDASIYGVELSVRKDFSDTLPAPFDGFVFDGNLTWIGSEFTYINSEGVERDPGGWVNQPEIMLNAQLSYEYGPVSAKVGYRWVDEYLSNIMSDSGDIYDAYAQPRGVLDLQARYDFTDMMTIIGEVKNVTEENLEFNRRFPSGDLLGGNSERGRVVWLGMNVRF